jgi:hypothetical protein
MKAVAVRLVEEQILTTLNYKDINYKDIGTKVAGLSVSSNHCLEFPD